jgi:hypothetical protein
VVRWVLNAPNGSTNSAPAEKLIHAVQAACEYSWRTPPSRSRRRTFRSTILAGSVKTHVQSLQRKLGARNRVEMAAWAWQSGLVE